jgi:hypothetical protein
MLKGYPGVSRYEQTDDVLQQALIRLYKALQKTSVESPQHLLRLAAVQVRRELIDMARHYGGPHGAGANHHTDGNGKAADDEGGQLYNRPTLTDDSPSIEEWGLFRMPLS